MFSRFFIKLLLSGLSQTVAGGVLMMMVQVPAPGDYAHRYIAPGPNDIRGPCPGMNSLANRTFLDSSGPSCLS
jgi:hypothetical protein